MLLLTAAAGMHVCVLAVTKYLLLLLLLFCMLYELVYVFSFDVSHLYIVVFCLYKCEHERHSQASSCMTAIRLTAVSNVHMQIVCVEHSWIYAITCKDSIAQASIRSDTLLLVVLLYIKTQQNYEICD